MSDDEKDRAKFIAALEAAKVALRLLHGAWNGTTDSLRSELACNPKTRHEVEGLKLSSENMVGFMHTVWEAEGN